MHHDQDPLAPKQVAEPAAGDEEGRQRELVDGDGPLQGGGGDAKVARDRRQGQVEREEVDVDAEDGQRDRGHDAVLGRCPQPCPFSHTARHPARDATGMNPFRRILFGTGRLPDALRGEVMAEGVLLHRLGPEQRARRGRQRALPDAQRAVMAIGKPSTTLKGV